MLFFSFFSPLSFLIFSLCFSLTYSMPCFSIILSLCVF